MTVIVKSKDELVVPRSVRRRAGIKSGDQVEFRVSGGIINIIPELPTADDEYTPARRRAIDARPGASSQRAVLRTVQNCRRSQRLSPQRDLQQKSTKAQDKLHDGDRLIRSCHPSFEKRFAEC